MAWFLYVVGALVALAAAAGAYAAFRNMLPDLVNWSLSTGLPALLRKINKRLPPEEEAEWRERMRSGETGGKDHHR